MVDALVALIAWLGLLSEAKDHRATTSARQVIPREHPPSDSPRNARFPATQPGGGLKCQLNVTKCQDKQRLRDYLFRINFILPSSA
jgi:hypothetical protein